MQPDIAFIRNRISRALAAVRGVLYGAGAHEIVLYAVRLRSDMESLFILITLGDLIGVPILPPYYSLRLLPFLVPNIASWKRRVLRERDILETDGLDLLAG
ncbi:MAG: hypothetical protein FJ009_08290 [Chloroflexi bacterium]|nr:hypothetical protein [Chloroflexota bacterium]